MGINPGQQIWDLANSIFPYCRSITGDGVRDTLQKISKYIAKDGLQLNICEVPSGTQAFDWTVPREWRIRDAYIADDTGTRIVDMKANNLHVMGYSSPVDQRVPLDELKKHIFTQPDQPSVIPYVTSYYKERFCFCMSKNQLNSQPEGQYHMYIDSEQFNGSLTY